MEWFKELRTGQKVLFIINAVLAVASFALIFTGAGSADFFIIGTAVASMNIFSILFAKTYTDKSATTISDHYGYCNGNNRERKNNGISGISI